MVGSVLLLDPGEAVKVDVAAGEDERDAAEVFEVLELVGENRCEGYCAAWLNDELHAAVDVAHGVDDLLFGDGDGAVDVAVDDVPGGIAEVCHESVGDGFGIVAIDALAGGH